jgi:hypothetical protein
MRGMLVDKMTHKDITIYYLMAEEISALRSVLSEFEGDKSEYLAMIYANDLRHIIETILIIGKEE